MIVFPIYYPGPTAPFGMVQLSPDTDNGALGHGLGLRVFRPDDHRASA